MTTDIRIELYGDEMNERQKQMFVAAVNKIKSEGWTWRRSPLDGSYQIQNGDGYTIGQGVSLSHALEAAESAP